MSQPYLQMRGVGVRLRLEVVDEEGVALGVLAHLRQDRVEIDKGLLVGLDE